MSWAAKATVIEGGNGYGTETDAEVLPPQSADLDPFFKVLANRCGPSIAGSFTPSQFAALKRAFAVRAVDPHPVDIRDSTSIFGFYFSMVLRMGRENRRAGRRRFESPTGAARLVRGGLQALWCGSLFAGAIIVIVCSATN